ncbi:MAG: hypothetical protein GF368_04290 [Candidatus Aenigmarchaeota archaeon]|nr:hypothetical protein [Candidatus Aenigmarchaeota archaeon]
MRYEGDLGKLRSIEPQVIGIETRGVPCAGNLMVFLPSSGRFLGCDPHNDEPVFQEGYDPEAPTILCDHTVVTGRTFSRVLNQHLKNGGDPENTFLCVGIPGLLYLGSTPCVVDLFFRSAEDEYKEGIMSHYC